MIFSVLQNRGDAHIETAGHALVHDSSVVSDTALLLTAGAYVVQMGKRKFARVALD